MTKTQMIGFWILSLAPLAALAVPTSDILCIDGNMEIHYSKNNTGASVTDFITAEGSYKLVMQRQKMGSELSDMTILGVFATNMSSVDFKASLDAHESITNGLLGHSGKLALPGDTIHFQFVLNDSRLIKITCKVLSAAESDGTKDGSNLLKEQADPIVPVPTGPQ